MLVRNSPGIQSWWCDDGNRTTNLLIGSITRYHHSRLTWRRRYQPYQTKRTIISTQSEASARYDTCDFLKYSSPVRRRIETCFWLFDRDFVTLVWVSWRPPEQKKKRDKSPHQHGEHGCGVRALHSQRVREKDRRRGQHVRARGNCFVVCLFCSS